MFIEINLQLTCLVIHFDRFLIHSSLDVESLCALEIVRQCVMLAELQQMWLESIIVINYLKIQEIR